VPAQSLQTDAFVLLNRPPTDAYQTLSVFSPVHGPLLVLQRLARKTTSSSAALDLFDEASLLLESSNQGRTWFIREAQLIRRPTGIGRSYGALQHASALAGLIARNTVDEASRSAIGELLRHAFAAFETDPRPDIVYFKSLYRFARDEGYPLKQQWFPTLPAADRTDVATLLNRPLAEQSASPELVARFQRRLEDYLRGHTEILLE
jgi:recombinational DNA repair protein (RecF pathway)